MGWWMNSYGADTAKRQYAYANSWSLRKLCRGKLPKGRKTSTTTPTCRRYKNRQGKQCYTGTRFLKRTETLRKHLQYHICTTFRVARRKLFANLCGPRIYPDAFGQFIANILEELIQNKGGCPDVPSPVPSGPETLASCTSEGETGLFEFADLAPAFEYLRGGKGLRIPALWKECVPKSI